MKAENYTIVNKQNEVLIDNTVFDVIDTEEKAYWLGFLYADGNIGSTECKLEVNLQASDWEHMKKFQEFLKYKKILYELGQAMVKVDQYVDFLLEINTYGTHLIKKDVLLRKL